MLDTVVRKLIEWRYERALRQFYLGNSVRVCEHQLPELWAAHTRRLPDPRHARGLRPVRDLAGAGRRPGDRLGQADDRDRRRGCSRTSGPASSARCVAHEVGHILSDHMLYMTALNILLSAGGSLPFFLGMPFRAVRAVLLEWYRAAELSCDRAATLAVRDPQIVCRTLMVLAGAMPADELNLDAFMAQAMEYEAWDDPSDRVRRFFNEIGKTHPYAVRRVSEVHEVGPERRVRPDRPRRVPHPRPGRTNVRDEASDAVEFYAERFRAIFREIGENINKAGSQVGGMAEQLADWLRTRSGDPAAS